MPDLPVISRQAARFFDGPAPIRSFFAPGRINIIGEHLDYNGGYVFPAAISLGIAGLVQDREDRLIRLKSEGYEYEAVAHLDRVIARSPSRSWADYPLGAIKYLTEKGHEIHTGKNILYASTLPREAGLSSSAAIEVLTAFMLAGDSIKTRDDRVRIARLMSDMETEWIGVRCGIMDQFTAVLGKRGHAILLDSGTLSYEYVPLPAGTPRFVIMNSNRARELSESKYNERRAECEEALASIRKRNPGARALALADSADLALVQDGTLRRRARHVLSEQRRVLESIAALRKGDFETFGSLLSESHRSLRDDYQVTGTELDALVSAAQDENCCLGARMTGAGFGGCALALIRGTEAAHFMERVGEKYHNATGLYADFYEFTPENGACEIDSTRLGDWPR
ncbi:MAG: galactokinase [Spirochaetes bacterium]|nr:galactokinase [Spirochaetota bacterium]